MHHVLEVQEIVLNIFGHCYWPEDSNEGQSELASLARTCRAFKEVALDLLWEELPNLSPLAACIPDASYQLFPGNCTHSFSRLLTWTEWDILQSYTRRIRYVTRIEWGLDEKSLGILSNPPTTTLLFSNLRQLRYDHTTKPVHLFHLPFPSLTSLVVKIEDLHGFQDSLKSFSNLSPCITTLCLFVNHSDLAFNKSVSNCICRWQNLQNVNCPEILLDVDALAHLSHIPALTKLAFKEIVTLPDCISLLLFSNLKALELRPTSLGTISRLLFRFLLPVIKDFTLTVDDCPSRQELSSFLAAVQASNTEHTIERLSLCKSSPPINTDRSEVPLLCFADLRPCMVFGSFREITLDIDWNVGLADDDILTLVSAWPSLAEFKINPSWGWNMPSGITPNGLLQMLQKCPSLQSILLAMDTRGYTELPPSNLALTLPSYIHINVLDSSIEAESVPAIAAFFNDIASRTYLILDAWSCRNLVKRQGWTVYYNRWRDAWGPLHIIPRCFFE